MDNSTLAAPLPTAAAEKEPELIGKSFGRLTVVARLIGKSDKYKYACTCVCGGVAKVTKYSLVNGQSKSCGCIVKEKLAANKLKATVGVSRTPEYGAWKNMWRRCTSPTDPSYNLYKERTPPAEWKDFAVFLAHVGLKPRPELSLDRIDNEKGYGPGNVRWATQEEQSSNTRCARLLTYEGKSQTLSEWAADLGVPRKTLYERLYHLKWSVARALTSPISV